MTTITRQALTDQIDPVDLLHGKKSEHFQRTFAWLFLAISQNDVISVTDPLRAQLDVMFRDMPATRGNLKTLLGA